MQKDWPGLHERVKEGKKGKIVAVELLVKTARFTVSISTFSLCGSMGSKFIFPDINTAELVQFTPLQLPFILAALEPMCARGSICPPRLRISSGSPFHAVTSPSRREGGGEMRPEKNS